MGKAADAELGGVRSKLEEVTTDVASVRESIRQFELESKEFFGIFVESLDRARRGIDEIQVGHFEWRFAGDCALLLAGFFAEVNEAKLARACGKLILKL